MRKSLLLVFFLLTAFFCDSACAGQVLADLNLQVEGTAPVMKNDEARAREEAIKNALEKAILQAAVRILPEKFADEKLQAAKSVMINQADRYVKNYRMISEQRQHDDYNVNVNVVVALKPVSDDLMQMGILQDRNEKENVSVALSVKGARKYSEFVRLKNFLQNRPKIVRSIYPCRLEWQQVHFDLVVGSVRNLVAELEKTGSYTIVGPKNNQDVVEINLWVKEEAR